MARVTVRCCQCRPVQPSQVPCSPHGQFTSLPCSPPVSDIAFLGFSWRTAADAMSCRLLAAGSPLIRSLSPTRPQPQHATQNYAAVLVCCVRHRILPSRLGVLMVHVRFFSPTALSSTHSSYFRNCSSLPIPRPNPLLACMHSSLSPFSTVPYDSCGQRPITAHAVPRSRMAHCMSVSTSRVQSADLPCSRDEAVLTRNGQITRAPTPLPKRRLRAARTQSPALSSHRTSAP